MSDNIGRWVCIGEEGHPYGEGFYKVKYSKHDDKDLVTARFFCGGVWYIDETPDVKSKFGNYDTDTEYWWDADWVNHQQQRSSEPQAEIDAALRRKQSDGHMLNHIRHLLEKGYPEAALAMIKEHQK